MMMTADEARDWIEAWERDHCLGGSPASLVTGPRTATAEEIAAVVELAS